MEPTLEQIRNMSYDEKIELAKDPNTPVDVLEILAKNEEYWSVRRYVAWNPNTPVELLAELATDENEYVRRGVANNPNTPVELLRELAKDKDGNVRWYVAKNTNATEQVLVSVFEYERSHEKDSDVLEALIANANCPDYLKAVIQTKLEEMK
jgi:hypothetical protein